MSVERQPSMGRSGFGAKDASAGRAPIGDFQRLHSQLTSRKFASCGYTCFLRW